MPISKTTGYRASDGVMYATVGEAQEAELGAVFNAAAERIGFEQWLSKDKPDTGEISDGRALARDILENASEMLLSALTTGPRSRPRARKAAGTTNPRRAVRAKPAECERATPEAASAGFKEMHAAVDAA